MAKNSIYIIMALVAVITIIGLLFKISKLQEERESTEQKIRRWKKMALTDNLTKLGNRMAFNIKIDMLKGIKENDIIGILLFDVDNFKLVNDVEGHLAGDRKLKEVAIALLEVFDSPDCTVYRFGGDEFAVITKNYTEEEIIGFLLKIRELEQKSGIFSLSKGYAIVNTLNIQGIEKAIDRADEMLYADKLLKHKITEKNEKIS